MAACATASSPDAWVAFRQQVVDVCASASGLGTPDVKVDPFGTESYGLASVSGLTDDGTERTVICVVRKSPDGVTDAEISAGLDEWVVAPENAVRFDTTFRMDHKRIGTVMQTGTIVLTPYSAVRCEKDRVVEGPALQIESS